MSRTLHVLYRRGRDALRDRRGMVAPAYALMMGSLLALGGFAVDVGNVMRVKQALQSSVDAAALAGAGPLYLASTTTDINAAISKAQAYSAGSGNNNAIPNVNATMVSGYPQVACLTTLRNPPYSLPCPAGGGNALRVAMTAQVPLAFGALVGYRNYTVRAQATASVGGGQATNLDIVVIMDTSGSMRNNDSACATAAGGSTPTQLQCAQKGAAEMLKQFNPTKDRVAMFTFPGLTTASPVSNVAIEYCGVTGTILQMGDRSTTGVAKVADYNQSPTFQIVPFSTDYKTTALATTLNANSNLVKTLGSAGNPSITCQGIQALNNSSTYFGSVVTAAQTYLTTYGRANTQKVIILLSDGDGNNTSLVSTPCQSAINAATAATAAGTWVYTMAHKAASSGCRSDSRLTPCQTLQRMASDSTKMFFSDAASACTGAIQMTDLVSTFQKLGASLMNRVLVPDTTT